MTDSTFPGATDDDARFEQDIASIPRHCLMDRCRNGRSWITAFHKSLDGIDGLFSIPGGGIDGCRDHWNVRAIVEHILKEKDALRTERDALKADVQDLKAFADAAAKLLQMVLDNDEAMEGFGAGSLGGSLKEGVQKLIPMLSKAALRVP